MDTYQNAMRQPQPNNGPVTMTQATRLARLSGLPIEELTGQSLSAVERKLSWILAPELLGLRKISGRVVRRNLETRALEPIPNATVHMDDTDCSFLLYSPPQWADWSWLLPFRLRSEEIATATTDASGHFCFYLPRWEIAAVAGWRQGRIGVGDFSRPRLRDIVKDLEPEYLAETPEVAIRKPGLLAGCRKKVGQALTDYIEALLLCEGAARSEEALEMLLETRVVPERPSALDDLLPGEIPAKVAARESGFPHELVKGLGFDRSIGPLWRNSDLVLKLWTLLLDVPDITFRVTRGSREEGGEELLYSDGFFDVPWNRDGIPALTLTASDPAFSTSERSRRRSEYEELSEAA